MKPLLQIKDLRTYFFTIDGIVKAVDGISYDVNEGEIVGLVGESGSGKSISALSIVGLIPNPPGKIVSGEVIFEGNDLCHLSRRELQKIRGRRIGMVFQEPMTSLNPVLTIGRQLAEPLEIHLGLKKQKAMAKAAKLLQSVRIPAGTQRLHQYPHHFSGGMRQRVMIAIGMSCRPKLLIADEPTTALDVTIQAQVLELTKNMIRKTGTSMIIITHNLGVIARYADRVNVMYAGKIVETASAKDLYGQPTHPYTRGLIKSVPRLDQKKKERLVPIKGNPPDLSNLPPGCSFSERCEFTMDICRREQPPFFKVRNQHKCACWLVGE